MLSSSSFGVVSIPGIALELWIFIYNIDETASRSPGSTTFEHTDPQFSKVSLRNLLMRLPFTGADKSMMLSQPHLSRGVTWSHRSLPLIQAWWHLLRSMVARQICSLSNVCVVGGSNFWELSDEFYFLTLMSTQNFWKKGLTTYLHH